jgi:hypothetical protein
VRTLLQTDVVGVGVDVGPQDLGRVDLIEGAKVVNCCLSMMPEA